VLAKFSPVVNLSVKNTLAGDDRKDDINLTFKNIRDFEPEQVAKNIPQLRVLLAMRNLLRDLKSNLLDNAAFRRELEIILKDPDLSQELRDELATMMPEEI
jgi:type VI secretion system protein ImpB